MNKALKIFVKVIYYVFTFGLGILLALVLPGLLVTANLPKHIEEYLNEGKYAESINLLIGYDDKEIAYQEDFSDGSGIVLFRTLILDEEEDVNGNTSELAKTAYSGFLYKTDGNYNASLETNNKTKLIVNKGESDEAIIQLLNYDSNSDDMYDNIMSLVECTFVYFDVPEEKAENIKSLTFVDCDGDVYKSVNTGGLTFDDPFFTGLQEFIETYNETPKSDKLSELEAEFLALSSNYEKCSYRSETKRANREGAVYIVIYFVAIYIIGDFLVGRHYIIKFFIWLTNKIRGKKEDKEKKEADSTEGIYGTDYFTKLTVRFHVPEDCMINISVNYHNENNEIEMLFSRDKDYTVTERVHAGTYVNAWLESPGYVAENLPKTLEVRGFSMSLDVDLRKEDAKEEKK